MLYFWILFHVLWAKTVGYVFCYINSGVGFHVFFSFKSIQGRPFLPSVVCGPVDSPLFFVTTLGIIAIHLISGTIFSCASWRFSASSCCWKADAKKRRLKAMPWKKKICSKKREIPGTFPASITTVTDGVNVAGLHPDDWTVHWLKSSLETLKPLTSQTSNFVGHSSRCCRIHLNWKIKNRVEKWFPQARSFKRPGFDDENCL